jgi:hypothetical protein
MHYRAFVSQTANAPLIPIYMIAELLPSTREGAEQLGLVTLEQTVSALVLSVEQFCSRKAHRKCA